MQKRNWKKVIAYGSAVVIAAVMLILTVCSFAGHFYEPVSMEIISLTGITPKIARYLFDPAQILVADMFGCLVAGVILICYQTLERKDVIVAPALPPMLSAIALVALVLTLYAVIALHDIPHGVMCALITLVLGWCGWRLYNI